MENKKKISLDPWNEVTGLLKKVNRDSAIFSIENEIEVQIPPGTISKLQSLIGEKIRLLKAEGYGGDDFRIIIEGSSSSLKSRVEEHRKVEEADKGGH